ncbi:MAG: thioredoxin family protein [Synergistaceae bacterium]|jgi:glutaredoxin|nr:thioredoxin family protein [Synergistaceae bacterium]
MKEIKMFMKESCPHCKKAQSMMDEIYASHPEYKEIPLKKIDERLDPNYAAKFDYYYVPTFYVGDDKLHEGVPSKEAIMKVFVEAAK